jgi:hypothetical protein
MSEEPLAEGTFPQSSDAMMVDKGPPVSTWLDFLKEVPIGTDRFISDATEYGLLGSRSGHQGFGGGMVGGGFGAQMTHVPIPDTPEPTLLFCSGRCLKETFFQQISHKVLHPGIDSPAIFIFRCNNCTEFRRVFVFHCKVDAQGDLYLRKIGQEPILARPLDTAFRDRLRRMSRESLQLFESGYELESQSYGVGAFVYYRQSIERVKNNLIGLYFRAFEQSGLSVDDETREQIRQRFLQASAETRFEDSLKKLPAHLPEELQIKGQNPLKLIHGCLSEGIHELTDKECLELASTVRLVFEATIQKLEAISRNTRQLNDAIDALIQREQAKQLKSK